MDIDKIILDQLLAGKTQLELVDYLKEKNLKPNSLSAIEKHLKVLRKKYNANTMFQIGAIISLERMKQQS